LNISQLPRQPSTQREQIPEPGLQQRMIRHGKWQLYDNDVAQALSGHVNALPKAVSAKQDAICVFVRGRLKPASRGRVKSGHFERNMVGHVDSWISQVLESREVLHGELSQDGNGTGDIDTEGAWLV